MRLMKLMAKKQRGFTLVELVVVIAILGTLAAISVPMVTNYLTQAKQRAYISDVERVQAAVDAYLTAPNNPKFLGAPQFPIKGLGNGSASATGLRDTDGTGDTEVTTPKNPLGGTKGGNPNWKDDGDGLRTGNSLFGTAAAATVEGWRLVAVTRQSKTYYVDTRDYIIDMSLLTTDDAANNKKPLLDGAPSSASSDNVTGGTGSYTYYVDANGKVQTLLNAFPTSTKTGFQNVHP
ncbi:MAG: prepilin-type N-terminal cleavage/methylation domain-containing protein [Chloroflexi bacterium]|nr:prepilin-type N-terminal cleavage/methylation domain-containing protein [Chloroflexota bacterium]